MFQVTVTKCCGCKKPLSEPRTLYEMGENWSTGGFCGKCLPAYLRYLGPIAKAPVDHSDQYRDPRVHENLGGGTYRKRNIEVA